MTTDSPYAAPLDPTPAGAEPVPARQARLWPAVALVVGYWCLVAFVKLLGPQVLTQLQQFLVSFYSPFVLAIGILVWWLFFSRQPWAERLAGLGLLIVGGIGAKLLADKSMAFGLLMDALPVAITAVVLAVVLTRMATAQTRLVAIGVMSVLAWGYFTLIRVDGVTGKLSAERSWRWNPTAEDKFLKERKSQAGEAPAASAELVATAADWTEFRGPLRNGHIQNVSLNADWTAQPPRELWRRRVGPGWSSFAVVGDRAFTQEQRGKMEAVVSIDIATGKEIWSHEDDSRFEETVAGAGPRATPTFSGGKIYSLGGKGMLNCLDTTTGKPIWSRDITADAKAKPTDENMKPPGWGFSSSPLVAQGIVAVFAGGKEGKGVLAYDALTGDLRWSAGKGIHSYSSPQLLKVAGQEQLFMVSDHGLEAFDPASGKLLWEHDWYLKEMFRVVQPHVAGDGQVLIGTPMTYGTRLLEVAPDGDDWKVAEKWTSKDLKPYFNDCVQLGDYLYGFDNDILVCIDLATGKKKWKKGRYGNGQALLIGDQGQMLVISEEGDAVLVEVSPQGLNERGKFKALTGKTWNHPVIAGGKLLVRNSEEMACYELIAAAPTSDL